jgi:osmotically-inducible protein OsmY
MFATVLAIGMAPSQTTSPGSATTLPSPPKTANAAQVGDRTGSTGGNASGNTEAGAGNATTEAQAGETGTTASDLQDANELQENIRNALRNEPTLIHDDVSVSVSEDKIDLSGSVGSTKEKLTAQRIVQSYAENRKVSNRLTINSHNHNDVTNPTPPKPRNPAGNPDHNTNNPPSPPPT